MKNTHYILIVLLMLGSVGLVHAEEYYSFRQVEFQEGSECAELFIKYITSEKYDYIERVPALMNFDSDCDSISS